MSREFATHKYRNLACRKADGPLKLDLGEILQGNAQLDLRLENGTEPLFKIERKSKLQKLGSIDGYSL